MTNREKKLRIIEEIISLGDKNPSSFIDRYINALYEIIVNDDYDYIEDVFYEKQDLKDFIEKFSEGEE